MRKLTRDQIGWIVIGWIAFIVAGIVAGVGEALIGALVIAAAVGLSLVLQRYMPTPGGGTRRTTSILAGVGLIIAGVVIAAAGFALGMTIFNEPDALIIYGPVALPYDFTVMMAGFGCGLFLALSGWRQLRR
jgi:hypothetical protein